MTDRDMELTGRLDRHGRVEAARDHADRARRNAKEARHAVVVRARAAAASLVLSAESQDRTASAVERSAECGGFRELDLRKQAARHRKYAVDDRRMANDLLLRCDELSASLAVSNDYRAP